MSRVRKQVLVVCILAFCFNIPIFFELHFGFRPCPPEYAPRRTLSIHRWNISLHVTSGTSSQTLQMESDSRRFATTDALLSISLSVVASNNFINSSSTYNQTVRTAHGRIQAPIE